jgi:hypothetical protein
VVLFYSKKHKEKMPSLVEQTFVYRRSIIENNNGAFLDLLDQFKYLTDTKNVNYFLDFNLSIKLLFLFKLETEFSLLAKNTASKIKSQLQKIMIVLWDYFNISNTVGYTVILFYIRHNLHYIIFIGSAKWSY